jgi:threonine/homoserine/homoserine lactone efflux protein
MDWWDRSVLGRGWVRDVVAGWAAAGLTVGVVGELVGFVGLSAVVICTPGPDTALTVRNAIVSGRAAGVWTAAGVVTGQAIWTVAASVGLVSLLSASEPAFLAVKLAGTAYLCYLGLQSLRGAWTGSRAGQDRPPRRLHSARAFRQGVLNDLGNPKMAAFFISVLPQFAPSGHGGVAALATLLGFGLLFCGLTFGWLAAYSVAIGRVRRLLDRDRVRRALDAVLGAVLIGFGVRLALSQPSP